MKKYFLPFNPSLLRGLYELGFNEYCFATYEVNNCGGELIMGSTYPTSEYFEYHPNAPLYCQVQDWLREKHQINLEVYQADSGNFPYYEALLKGIEKSVEFLNNLKK